LRIIYFNKNEEKESELEKIIVFRMRKDVQEKVKSNINDLDKKGRTPLDFALELGFKNAYDVFRKYGGKTSKELEDENNS
jgi:ankyrin repeat protein